jgi:hypothetical protein
MNHAKTPGQRGQQEIQNLYSIMSMEHEYTSPSYRNARKREVALPEHENGFA